MEKKLILKSFGLYNPTEVEYGNKILVTNQIDVKSTCELWKWYFGLRCYERISLYIKNKRDYNSMEQKTLASVKSVKELFYENGFEVKLLEDENEIVSDWKLYRKSNELCDREEARKETAREILKSMLNKMYKLTGCGVPYHVKKFIEEIAVEYGVELFGNSEKLEDGE